MVCASWPRRKPRIGADAAQQAVVDGLDGRIDVEVAETVVGRRQIDRVVERSIAAEAGQVAVQAELAAEHRLIERVVVVDQRMDHWNLALAVVAREAVEVHRADVEEAAVAASLQVDLGEHEVGCRGQQVQALDALVEPVVLEVRAVGDQRAVPAVDPFVGQPECPEPQRCREVTEGGDCRRRETPACRAGKCRWRGSYSSVHRRRATTLDQPPCLT